MSQEKIAGAYSEPASLPPAPASKQGQLIVREPGTLGYFTSVPATNIDLSNSGNRKILFNLGAVPCMEVPDVDGETLDCIAYAIIPGENVDPETGEVEQYWRTLFLLADGRVVGTTGETVLRRMGQLLESAGPGPWDPPIQIILDVRRSKKSGHAYHQITLALYVMTDPDFYKAMVNFANWHLSRDSLARDVQQMGLARFPGTRASLWKNVILPHANVGAAISQLMNVGLPTDTLLDYWGAAPTPDSKVYVRAQYLFRKPSGVTFPRTLALDFLWTSSLASIRFELNALAAELVKEGTSETGLCTFAFDRYFPPIYYPRIND